MKTKEFFTLFFLLLVGICSAQVAVEFSPDFPADKFSALQLDDSERRQVEEALTERLAAYVERGKLLNPKTRVVDRESAIRFKELFSLDAKIFNDLREVPEQYLRSVDEYIDLARSYFSAYGLSFGLNKASITDGEFVEGTGRYTFTIVVSKTVSQYFKENGVVENGTRTYTLDFIYSIKLSEPENARINMIRRSVLDDAKPADLYVGLSELALGVGYGIPSFSETAFFNDGNKEGKLNLKSDFTFNIGPSTYSNGFNKKDSPNKRLFLTGGAMGFYQKITGELRDYNTNTPINVQGRIPETQVNVAGDVLRIAQNVDIDEEQTLIGLRATVGVAVRLHNKNTSFSMLKLQYAPSMVIPSSTLGNMKGTGDYAIDINDADQNHLFNSLEENAYADNNFAIAYDIGMQKEIKAEPELKKLVTSHGIMVSGLYFKDFVDDSPTFGVAVGLHYYLPLTGLWNFEKGDIEDKPFLYTNSEYVKHGVLSPFMEDVKLSYIGISINVYRKKTRQP